MTTYEKLGGNEFFGGFASLMAGLFPDRDNGPHEGLHITFDNGVILSIVWGGGTYSGPNTVEVGVFGKDGRWITEEVALAAFGGMPGDSVDGNCDAERVHGYFVMAQGWIEGTTTAPLDERMMNGRPDDPAR